MTAQLTLPEADVPVIDETRMQNEFGGAPDILAELRDLFLDHAPQIYGTIVDALEAGDGAAIADSTHSLKGACATYGAERIAVVCKQMELAARAGDIDASRAYRQELDKEYEAVMEAVKGLRIG